MPVSTTRIARPYEDNYITIPRSALIYIEDNKDLTDTKFLVHDLMPKRRKEIDVTKAIRLETKVRKLRNDLKRPSVLLPLKDEDFHEKFQVIFEEHIQGFKAKRLKAVSNLEWKERAAKKKVSKVDLLNRQKAIEAYRKLKKKTK